jgi:hypothetical protein
MDSGMSAVTVYRILDPNKGLIALPELHRFSFLFATSLQAQASLRCAFVENPSHG